MDRDLSNPDKNRDDEFLNEIIKTFKFSLISSWLKINKIDFHLKNTQFQTKLFIILSHFIQKYVENSYKLFELYLILELLFDSGLSPSLTIKYGNQYIYLFTIVIQSKDKHLISLFLDYNVKIESNHDIQDFLHNDNNMLAKLAYRGLYDLVDGLIFKLDLERIKQENFINFKNKLKEMKIIFKLRRIKSRPSVHIEMVKLIMEYDGGIQFSSLRKPSYYIYQINANLEEHNITKDTVKYSNSELMYKYIYIIEDKLLCYKEVRLRCEFNLERYINFFHFLHKNYNIKFKKGLKNGNYYTYCLSLSDGKEEINRLSEVSKSLTSNFVRSCENPHLMKSKNLKRKRRF